MLIQQRLEFTDDLGVATAIQGREGDGFIQRLIIETEEEISRLETRRLELSKVINSQEIRRKLDSRESIRTSEPEGTDKPSCKELHAELMRARLDYEVQSRSLPERRGFSGFGRRSWRSKNSSSSSRNLSLRRTRVTWITTISFRSIERSY